MAVNRYNLPAQQPLINTYQPLPFKELLAAGQEVQSQKDLIEQQRQALADTNLYALDPDLDYVTGIQNELDSRVNAVTDAYATGNIRDAKRAYEEASRWAKKELNPLTGRTGKAMANYDARAKAYAEAKKRFDKGLITQNMLSETYDYLDKAYADQGGVGTDPRNMQGYNVEEIAEYYDFADFANTYGKGFEKHLNDIAYSKVGDQFIKEGSNAREWLTEEEITNALYDFAKGDDKLINYLRQGTRIGYTNQDALKSAIYGAADKYSFDRKTTERKTKGNPNYKFNTERKDKIQADLPVSMQANYSMLGGKFKVSPFEALTGTTTKDKVNSAINKNNQNINQAEQRIESINRALASGGNTQESVLKLEQEKAGLGRLIEKQREENYLYQQNIEAATASQIDKYADLALVQGLGKEEAARKVMQAKEITDRIENTPANIQVVDTELSTPDNPEVYKTIPNPDFIAAQQELMNLGLDLSEIENFKDADKAAQKEINQELKIRFTNTVKTVQEDYYPESMAKTPFMSALNQAINSNTEGLTFYETDELNNKVEASLNNNLGSFANQVLGTKDEELRIVGSTIDDGKQQLIVMKGDRKLFADVPRDSNIGAQLNVINRVNLDKAMEVYGKNSPLTGDLLNKQLYAEAPAVYNQVVDFMEKVPTSSTSKKGENTAVRIVTPEGTPNLILGIDSQDGSKYNLYEEDNINGTTLHNVRQGKAPLDNHVQLDNSNQVMVTISNFIVR